MYRSIIAILFIFIFNSYVLADTPADIVVNFDAKTRILSVGVAHRVRDLKEHFIKQINIKVNGKNWITQNFLSQINLAAQAASYATVDLDKGDVVEVTAICNKKGKLTKIFKIG